MCSSLWPLCYKTNNSSGTFSPADRTFEANVSADGSAWTDVRPWEESWVFHFSSSSEQWRSLISGEVLAQQDFSGRRPHFRASSRVSDLWGQFFGCLQSGLGSDNVGWKTSQRQACVFPSLVQIMGFSTRGLQTSYGNIPLMMTRNRREGSTKQCESYF